MKDLKLPEMSREERNRAWRELNVDDIIVEIEYSPWANSHSVKERKVVRRTPKGFIRLDNDVLLKRFEYEYYTITKELEEWFEKIKLEEEIMSLVSQVYRDKRNFKSNLDYTDALKLKEILERTINSTL